MVGIAEREKMAEPKTIQIRKSVRLSLLKILNLFEFGGVVQNNSSSLVKQFLNKNISPSSAVVQKCKG